jgi:hypothetical protein
MQLSKCFFKKQRPKLTFFRSAKDWLISFFTGDKIIHNYRNRLASDEKFHFVDTSIVLFLSLENVSNLVWKLS